ncbi:hypothetical protein [Novosphingobium sp. JCM 18896]|uniref:hypothetical protein n=1 Tax=Novosphingobium sp. JCM 18896 TaxID=2989731 RepID=UPI002222C1AD|nr:hypothetical protein [Novosphingobium sp. JCM 18896]MCW1429491.1 hypothetical protein [Novosphingobium sp. JCM 18896]
MLTLAAGDYALALAPERGGAVLRFDWHGRSLLRQSHGPRNAALDHDWRCGWSVASATTRSATLLLHHLGADCTYIASQAFALDESGLTMTLSLVNLGRRPMPAEIDFGLDLDDVEIVARQREVDGPILLASGAVRSASLRLRATAREEVSYFG